MSTPVTGVGFPALSRNSRAIPSTGIFRGVVGVVSVGNGVNVATSSPAVGTDLTHSRVAIGPIEASANTSR